MCASCGCGMPNEKHGDDRNITWDEVKAAADAQNITAKETTQNMQEMARQQAS